jgi:hypothetical protein
MAQYNDNTRQGKEKQGNQSGNPQSEKAARGGAGQPPAMPQKAKPKIYIYK